MACPSPGVKQDQPNFLDRSNFFGPLKKVLNIGLRAKFINKNKFRSIQKQLGQIQNNLDLGILEVHGKS